MPGAGLEREQVDRIASAQCTVTFGAGGRVQQRLAQALIDLHHMHVGDALGQVLRQHAQAPADLEHDILAI